MVNLSYSWRRADIRVRIEKAQNFCQSRRCARRIGRRFDWGLNIRLRRSHHAVANGEFVATRDDDVITFSYFDDPIPSFP